MIKYYAIWNEMDIPHVQVRHVAEEEQVCSNITPPLHESPRLALLALAASFEDEFKRRRNAVVDFLRNCQ